VFAPPCSSTLFKKIKAVFGKGAVQAAKFLAGKPAGMYNMSDVINAAMYVANIVFAPPCSSTLFKKMSTLCDKHHRHGVK